MTACGWILPPAQTRGNKVEAEQLKELVPGTSTKADVTALIGSPTQRATFDENTWLYITEVTRPRLGRTLGVLDQAVVVLTFDDRGVLAQLHLPAPKRHSCSNFWAISASSTRVAQRLQAAAVPAHRLAAVSELRDRLILGSFRP
jgi:outer membrane protein assembly factor BamE (lipoprotein component of BamABCDE complex)